jgi:hypothetical protein
MLFLYVTGRHKSPYIASLQSSNLMFLNYLNFCISLLKDALSRKFSFIFSLRSVIFYYHHHHHRHHHHQWRYSPDRTLASLYGFSWWLGMYDVGVISPTINLSVVILIRPPETSGSKASRHLVAKQVKYGWETWPLNFANEASVHARRFLLHAVNLRYGTDGFTSPPKEGVLRILSPLKSIVLGRVWNREPWVQWQAP